MEATERSGVPKAQAARLFGVSLSSVKRYARLARRGGSPAPAKGSGQPAKIDENAKKKLLDKDVEERPAFTVSQRRRFLEHTTGQSLGHSTVGRMLKRMSFTQKTWRGVVGGKGRVLEGGLEDERRREALCGPTGVVDEMGANTTSLAPLYAWAPKGERARCSVPEEPRQEYDAFRA